MHESRGKCGKKVIRGGNPNQIAILANRKNLKEPKLIRGIAKIKILRNFYSCNTSWDAKILEVDAAI
jgi:hypothetical protein